MPTRRKTHETTASVDDFIDSLADESRRRDCRSITKLMRAATGQPPRMWGPSIIGFGKRHYRYASGQPAEICKVGFAPRARSFALYLAPFPGREALFKQLGKIQRSGGCLHLKSLTDVNLQVLAKLVRGSYRVDNHAR